MENGVDEDFGYIETYNAADETINFGTRCMADGDNLYEVVTLCVIKTNSEVSKSFEDIEARVVNEHVYLSTGKAMRVFGDISCSNLVFSVNLKTIIDTFCVCESYTLLGLRNGTVVFVDLDKPECITPEKLTENVLLHEKFFVGIFPDPANGNDEFKKFIAVDKFGTISRITAVCSTTDKPEVITETIVKLERNLTASTLAKNRILLYGTNNCYLYNLSTGERLLLPNISMLKCYGSQKLKFWILNADNSLNVICARTGTVWKVPGVYQNIVFMQNLSAQNIYASMKEADQTSIKFLNAEDPFNCEEVYSIACDQDAIYLVESSSAYGEQLFLSAVENELRVHMIVESQPESRLARLLRKHQCSEAERFAERWGLDMEPVLQAKAREIVDRDNLGSQDLDVLIALLDSIRDVQFKLTCCRDATCGSFDNTSRILEYGSALICNLSESDDYLINNMIYNLDTYKSLITYKNVQFSSNYWNEFYDCDQWKNLLVQLQKGNIEISTILFTRLTYERMVHFSLNDIEDALSILSRMPRGTALSFLHMFVPKILDIMPSTLPIFVRWMKETVFHMETTSNVNFPEDAISFMERMAKLLILEDDVLCRYDLIANEEGSVVEDLNHFMNSLRTIQTLKNNYMVFLPLKDCLKGPSALIHSLLTLKICNMDAFLTDFLINYIIENNFIPDEIFSHEIRQLIDYEQQYWIYLVPSLWKCISSMEVKLETLKCVLKKANLPWDPVIRSMTEAALQLNHPKVAMIKDEVELEPVYIVLTKPEYGLNNELFDHRNDEDMFAVQRVMHCDTKDMESDVYILHKDEKPLIDLMLIDHYIKKSEAEKAIKVVDRVDSKQFLDDLPVILHLLDFFTANYSGESCTRLISSLTKKLKICDTEGTFTYYGDLLHKYLSLIKLNKTFKRKFELENISVGDQVDSTFATLLDMVIDDFHAGIRGVKETIALWIQVSNWLQVLPDLGLTRLCAQLNEYQVVINVAEYVRDYATTAESMAAIVEILLKSVGMNQSEVTCLETTVLENGSTDDTDLNVQRIYLKLARTIAVKTMLHYNVPHEGLNWILCSLSIDGYLYQEMTSKLFEHFYSENIMFSTASACAIQNVYSDFCRFKGSSPVRALKNGSPKEQGDLHKESAISTYLDTVLPCILQNLYKSDHLLTAYSLLQSLHITITSMNYTSWNEALENKLTIFYRRFASFLIKKIFRKPFVDEDLAFILFSSFQHSELSSLIKSIVPLLKMDIEKFKVVANLGIRLCNYHNVDDSYYKKLRLKIKWWEETDKTGMTKSFSASPLDILLEKLTNLQLTLEQLQEFCSDFQIDVQKYYFVYLEKKLLNWKPSDRGSDNGLFQDCMKAAKLINNNDQVVSCLNKLHNSINMYHYEVHVCVLRMIEALVPAMAARKNQRLLEFLIDYDRVSAVGSSEREEWAARFPDVALVDPLSKSRLPFSGTLLSKDLWTVLKPEVNLRNYQKWFNAVSILDKYLSKDEICCYVIKQVVTDISSQHDTKWTMHPKYVQELEQIDDCLRQISNLEKATQVAYYLVSNMPQGADQVNAAKICYNLALESRKANPDKSEVLKSFSKVEKKYQGYAAMHVLHTNGLAEAAYLKLVHTPHELIEQLYCDERIVKKAKVVVLQCPDINRTVDELAKIFLIDVMAKRQSLLERWLHYDVISETNPNESIFAPMATLDLLDSENNYLCRSCYICMSNVDYWQQYLVNIGFETTIHCGVQARVLKCLCSISSKDTLKELLPDYFGSIKDHIDQLVLQNNLHSLGWKLDMESLLKYNKKSLLSMLSKNPTHPLNIIAMSQVCICFNIYEMQYFKLIVKNMIKQNMYEELKVCLNALKKQAPIYKQFYIDAWQVLTDHTFRDLVNGEEQGKDNDLCLQVMRSLQYCPVLNKLNLKNAFNACVNIKRMDLAALVLQYLPADCRKNLLPQIVSAHSKRELVVLLKDLEKYGLLGCKHVISLIDGFVH